MTLHMNANGETTVPMWMVTAEFELTRCQVYVHAIQCLYDSQNKSSFDVNN